MRRDLVLLRKATARRVKAASLHKQLESKSAFEPFMPRAAAAHFITNETIPALTSAAGEYTPGRGLATPCDSFIDSATGTKKFEASAAGYEVEVVNETTTPVPAETRVRAYLIDGEWVIDKDSSNSDGKSILAHFTLTSDLSRGAGNTATANVITTNDSPPPSSITVVSRGSERAFTNATGIAIKVETGPSTYQWWILKIEQPAMRIVAKLDTHPESYGSFSDPLYRYGADPREPGAAIASSPAPYALTEYPFSYMPSSIASGGLVSNPFKKFGEAGDYAILEWDKSIEEYILVDVIPATTRELWAKLTADRGDGLGSTLEVALDYPIADGELPGEAVNAGDHFNVAINAKEGDEVYLRWIPARIQYVAIEATHVARRVKGKIKADFSGRPATFRFVPDSPGGMDGRNPPLDFDTELGVPKDHIVVQNRYGWEAGKTDQKIEILWDTHTGEWYPADMECPTDPTPTYF